MKIKALISHADLMDVYCNNSLVTNSLEFLQIVSGLSDKRVQQSQKRLVSFLHLLLVVSRVLQCNLCVTCPQQLNPEEGYLSWEHGYELEKVEVLRVDGIPSLSDDTVNRTKYHLH